MLLKIKKIYFLVCIFGYWKFLKVTKILRIFLKNFVNFDPETRLVVDVVNLTNILIAAFTIYSFFQESSNLNSKHGKAACLNFCTRSFSYNIAVCVSFFWKLKFLYIINKNINLNILANAFRKIHFNAFLRNKFEYPAKKYEFF
jgi:hypothetical protein